ncbi:MAG: F0F1 ATP synthase subunit A [Planctomycetia bacterium]|mgnify:CR=1 FL=1|nr:F0F1 ATP synthase subunit A [Planctomycetia bacterium]
MADPVLHIKDSYFFEVPKFLYPHPYETLGDVQPFLRKAHPDATLDEFNHDLAGKIIIPQPFGTLKNLYTKVPFSEGGGVAISKFMILELVVAVFMVLLFSWLAGRISGGRRAKGRIANMFEAALIYMKEQIAEPAIGHHDAHKFVPLLWTMFFFVLFCNLLGMIPWLGNPTAAFGMTIAMACVTFFAGLVMGSKQLGIVGYWKNQVPKLGLPLYIAIFVVPLLFLIEVGGLFIKHGVLAVRLLANMVAGHLVLLAILGIAVAAASSPVWYAWYVAAPLSVLGTTAFSMLELMVSFLQAYVFTYLSALFIGAAVHHH